MPVDTSELCAPLSRCGMPHANSTHSRPRATSPRASASTLPCSRGDRARRGRRGGRRPARAGGTSPRPRRLSDDVAPTRRAASTAHLDRVVDLGRRGERDLGRSARRAPGRRPARADAPTRAVDPVGRRSSADRVHGCRPPIVRGGRACGRSRRRSSSASRPAASPSSPPPSRAARVQARGVREVGLEQDAVLADRVDEVGQLVPVVLEPERGVELLAEVLRRQLLQLRRARRARSPTSRSRASRG